MNYQPELIPFFPGIRMMVIDMQFQYPGFSNTWQNSRYGWPGGHQQ
jgi:hypothetical protein